MTACERVQLRRWLSDLRRHLPAVSLVRAALELHLMADADEDTFQKGIRDTDWYREFVAKHGEPNLDDPNYDYRAAWKAGARPTVRDPGDNMLHWPSQFKGDNHPNRYVDGVDTKTGQYTLPKSKRK